MSDPGDSVLRRILHAAGYRLEERPGGLRATRARDRRTILIVPTQRSPADLESEFPPDALHRTAIYPEDPGEVARRLASERGIEVLDPDSLGPALGELLLHAPPVSPPGSSSGVRLDSVLEAPTSVFPDGVRVVRARVGREDAETLAGVGGRRFQLRLVPFYAAPYRVRPAAPTGAPGRPSDHLAAVNALSGKVEIWEAGERELTEGPAGGDPRFEATLTEPECRSAAERELRRLHTVSVDHTEQHGGTIVIERRRLSPAPDDLKMGAGVFVFVPFWYIESREGRVVIDAVTGARAAFDAPELLSEP